MKLVAVCGGYRVESARGGARITVLRPDAGRLVGVWTTPAGVFFTVAGSCCGPRGATRTGGVLAGAVMASATIAATALEVRGPPATLLSVGSLVSWVGRADSCHGR